MAYDVQIVLDCAEPHPLAEWWADALGWQVEPSNEDFIRKMIAEGYASEDDTTTYHGVLVWRTAAAINHPDGRDSGRPRILFQQVPEPKTVKNRVHLDVRVGEQGRERLLERLMAAGATIDHRGNEGPHEWVTIRDPEGNELCLG